MKQWITKVAIATAIASSGGEARAWYFPEHAVVTEEGLAWLPRGAREAIARGLSDAAAFDKGSILCKDLSERFRKTTKDKGEPCVPYGVLPAMAADHSSTVEELERLLSVVKGGGTGRALLSGSREQWEEFLTRSKAAESLSQAHRVDLVRDLDLYLRAVDPDYSRRALGNITHFQAAGLRLSDLLRELAEKGRIDNAMGQFVGHHLRSLKLARGARAAGPERSARHLRAFVEHAYALHFLEDAFAAGHMVITSAYRDKPEDRLRRHDYFGRNGIAVTRALDSFSCALDRAGVRGAIAEGMEPCWITFGDGFMGDAGDVDRRHVAEAVARAQLQFAMALDPRWAEGLREDAACARGTPMPAPPAHRGSREGREIDLAMDLLDPFPAWSLSPEQRGLVPLSCARSQRVMEGALTALEQLDGCSMHPFSGNTTQKTPGAVCDEAIGQPFRPCVRPPEGLAPARRDPDASALCSAEEGVFLGSPDVSLLRPILAAWPVPQADPDTLKGADPVRKGFGYQVWLMNPISLRGPQPLVGAIGLGAAVGVSYRIENFFPERPNGASIELNVGLLQSLRTTEATRFSAYTVVELRMPMLSQIFWSAAGLISNSLARPQSWLDIFPTGGRVYFELSTDRQRPRFDGWDIEAFTFTLPQNSDTRGAQIISSLPLELRTRVGCDARCAAFAISLEFAGGVSRLF